VHQRSRKKNFPNLAPVLHLRAISCNALVACQIRLPFCLLTGVKVSLNVPSYQVEDEEGRTRLLIHLPIEEEDEDRWCLWRPDHAGFDSRSIFEGALVEE
jgi:hypothetical protein